MKNHSPCNDAEKNHSRLKCSFHSRYPAPWFFCSQRGARYERTILDWKFHSLLKACFFQCCLSRLIFFNLGALCVVQKKFVRIFRSLKIMALILHGNARFAWKCLILLGCTPRGRATTRLLRRVREIAFEKVLSYTGSQKVCLAVGLNRFRGKKGSEKGS